MLGPGALQWGQGLLPSACSPSCIFSVAVLLPESPGGHMTFRINTVTIATKCPHVSSKALAFQESSVPCPFRAEFEGATAGTICLPFPGREAVRGFSE